MNPKSKPILDLPMAKSGEAKMDKELEMEAGREGGTSNNNDQASQSNIKPIQCPRCDSLDTKFAYFNNYKTNQPRHLCKKCQRYWTEGGSQRSVPVGAARRKSLISQRHRPYPYQWNADERYSRLEKTEDIENNSEHNNKNDGNDSADGAEIVDHSTLHVNCIAAISD
ncbi:hypothetical protein ZOSMA_289G00200 [Zostera marina]|uniref:Dof-type domain-containing protein n=1 Tax=Zostera marina TaxID=29655 RepID=A0A0K9PCS7_ZOSMR|nr:hypothetical protein ZOSMA_289G00200 [Zostera marina]